MSKKRSSPYDVTADIAYAVDGDKSAVQITVYNEAGMALTPQDILDAISELLTIHYEDEFHETHHRSQVYDA